MAMSPAHRRLEQTAVASEVTGSALSPLIATCLSGFLFQFDLSALSAALPDIASSLSAPVVDQAWIINVYSLALIFALPLAGPIADRYGRRLTFMTGAILFALASILCAIAVTLSSLLSWRVLQGISGAALTACASAYLAAAYPGPRRAWAFGIWGTVIGASMVAGPPLGALITAVLGWSWIFWLNIPICAALVLLIARLRVIRWFRGHLVHWTGLDQRHLHCVSGLSRFSCWATRDLRHRARRCLSHLSSSSLP